VMLGHGSPKPSCTGLRAFRHGTRPFSTLGASCKTSAVTGRDATTPLGDDAARSVAVEILQEPLGVCNLFPSADVLPDRVGGGDSPVARCSAQGNDLHIQISIFSLGSHALHVKIPVTADAMLSA